jgi:hypothetical protein
VTKDELINALTVALEDAVLQLEYMNERWPTGTTEATLARIRHLFASVSTSSNPND